MNYIVDTTLEANIEIPTHQEVSATPSNVAGNNQTNEMMSAPDTNVMPNVESPAGTEPARTADPKQKEVFRLLNLHC